MYDITNPSTFENVLTWKNSFIHKGMVQNVDGFPFMVVGNKSDMDSETRQVSYNAGATLCKENGDMMFLETSAKENSNVDIAFT